MDDSRLEEILRRLDAIERTLQHHEHPHDHAAREHSHPHHRCHCRCHDDRRGRDHERPRVHGQPFEERRVVDLIVGLVAERVEEILWRMKSEEEDAVKPPPNDGENGSSAE